MAVRAGRGGIHRDQRAWPGSRPPAQQPNRHILQPLRSPTTYCFFFPPFFPFDKRLFFPTAMVPSCEFREERRRKFETQNGGGCGRKLTADVPMSDESRHMHTIRPRSRRGARPRRNTEEQRRSRRGSEMREPELAPALGRFPRSCALYNVNVPDRVTKND